MLCIFNISLVNYNVLCTLFFVSVLLRQNPHNVHEWHKRVMLLEGKPREVVTYHCCRSLLLTWQILIQGLNVLISELAPEMSSRMRSVGTRFGIPRGYS
jgi:hypothetical protein